MLECPVCKKATLKITFNRHEIPYFGEVMESLAKCSSCKYRHVDVFSLEEKEPCKYTFKIECEEDMLVRVVRSSRATVKVPELGVKITPGPASQGFISNVEGVIERVREVIEAASRDAGPKKKRKASKLLEKIESIKKGTSIATIIIEDPTGNSCIVSKKALKEELR
jgi:zinc finger protein